MNLRLLFAIKTPLTDFPCSNGRDIEQIDYKAQH